jgi:hypothetical protein
MMSTVEGRIDGGAMRDISGDDTRGTLQWGALRFCAIWRAAPPDENNEI